MLKSLIVATFALLIVPGGLRADIVFTFIDGAAGDQNGHTLSGTVTVDSACGTACTSDNFKDFTFTVSGPTSYSYSFQPSNSDVLINGPAALNVTSAGIFYDFDFGTYSEFTLRDGNNYYPLLTWQTNTDIYVSRPADGTSTWQDLTPVSGVVQIAAAVPEPSSFVYGGLISCLVGCTLWGKRRFA